MITLVGASAISQHSQRRGDEMGQQTWVTAAVFSFCFQLAHQRLVVVGHGHRQQEGGLGLGVRQILKRFNFHMLVLKYNRKMFFFFHCELRQNYLRKYYWTIKLDYLY